MNNLIKKRIIFFFHIQKYDTVKSKEFLFKNPWDKKRAWSVGKEASGFFFVTFDGEISQFCLYSQILNDIFSPIIWIFNRKAVLSEKGKKNNNYYNSMIL